MAREYSPTIDVNLQMRVQLALNQGTESQTRRGHVYAIANPHGAVMLRGSVEDQECSEQASQIAGSISGVKLVFNQIAVARDGRPLVL